MDGFNEFEDELKYDKYYCLNLKSYYHFPLAIKKLRKIIIDNKVDLVHSSLYWSTVLARFACPHNVPLVSSIQASLTDSVEYKKKWVGWLDRFSYNRRRSTIIGVSQHTLDDYFNFLKLKKKNTYLLYNFVDTKKYTAVSNELPKNNNDFRLITVGSLKIQKNHRFLLEAFTKLKDQNISLDIYGDGLLKEMLAKFISDNDLPVRLMGKVGNINEVIAGYDLFVMPSIYEGFSLAVLEGMVMEKPMLLSDTPTFVEQAADSAIYFSLNDVDDLVEKILLLKNDSGRLKEIAIKGRDRALQNFTLEHHMATLRKIYKDILSE